MIRDSDAAAEIRASWEGLKRLQARVHNVALGAFAQGSTITSLSGVEDVAFNLLLIHAYGVLNEALRQLRDEGVFQCKPSSLSPLMKAAQAALPWQDHASVRIGVKTRNEVAHDGKLLPKSACLFYIDCIERELIAWELV